MSQPQKQRLSDKAVTELLHRIHAGSLPIGSKLPSEPELALQMGISRGILREALSLLQTKGYLSRTQRGGSYVIQATDNEIGQSITSNLRTVDVRDLLEFREAMESKAVQFVIERAGDADVASLRQLVESGEGEKTGSIDYYFHYRIAELSGNRLFVVFLDMYYDTIHRFALESYRDAARKSGMLREHMRILEAIEKRDKRAAVLAIRGHLRNVLRRVTGDGDVIL